MRFVRIAAAVGVLALVAFTGMALAHVVKYPTASLTMEYANTDEGADEPDFFSGNVTAQKAACQASRKVTVYFDAPGVDVEVGTATTNDAGEWRLVAEDVAAGKYSAEADRKTLKLTVDHRHVCRAARSGAVQAGP